MKVASFSLVSDIRRQIKSGGVGMSKQDEQHPPVAILNGFKNASNEFASLLAEALKGLIPPIDIGKINMKTCRRVVLFDYNPTSNTLSMRHYRVNLVSTSVDNGSDAITTETPTQAVGMILNSRKSSKIPNLGHLVSISDLIGKPKAITDDDSAEQGAAAAADGAVEIYEKSRIPRKTSLKLSEIGPRIECNISRVFSGVEEGTILYAPAAPETVGSTVVKKVPKRKSAPATKRDEMKGSKKSRRDDFPTEANGSELEGGFSFEGDATFKGVDHFK
jgi:ribosome biogenesis protein SSF1/2